MGEELLLDCGLVERRENRLWLNPEIAALLDADADDAVAALCSRAFDYLHDLSQEVSLDDLADVLPDASKREELLAALGQRFDDRLRREIGDLGELIVVSALRDQLSELGYPNLARAVRHLSLETDRAGYDISAPKIGGGKRLIEVKAVTEVGEEVSFFLSRNEYETSQEFRDWFLVVCQITSLEERHGHIVGWLSATALPDLVPLDGSTGRWETGRASVEADRFVEGLPRASG
jgi:Domain of unknown function (DUF3883)